MGEHEEMGISSSNMFRAPWTWVLGLFIVFAAWAVLEFKDYVPLEQYRIDQARFEKTLDEANRKLDRLLLRQP